MMIFVICIVNYFSHNDEMKSQTMSLCLLVYLQKVEYRGRSVFGLRFFLAVGHKYKNSQYS